MTADRFSLKARRTTRIPLRIPVLIVHEHEGATRSFDGWTMIVNIHGAKIECKHAFALHQEVTIQVPFNKMSQKGKVVWARTELNEKGNREFGVELNEPENLWGVGFPPSDWDATKGPKAASDASAILDLAPPGAEIATDEVPEPKPAETAIAPPQSAPQSSAEGKELLAQEASPEAPVESSQREAPASQPQEMTWQEAALQIERNGVEEPIIEASFPDDETSMQLAEISMEDIIRHHNQSPAPKPTAEVPIATAPASSTPVESPVESVVAAPPAAAPASAASQASAPAGGPQPRPASNLNPTDKLSAFFNELVDSALEARLLNIVEGVSRRIESQVAAIEESTLTRIEQHAHATGTQQIEAMEQRTTEFLHTQQQAVLSGVQSFLAEVENVSRQRHMEYVEENLERIQQRADALLETGTQRLHENAAELVSASQQGLRASLEQLLPQMQGESLERCRVVGERLMSTQLEQWSLLFSDRLRQGQKTLTQRLDATFDEMLARHSATVSVRFEELESAAGARLDQQLRRIGTQVRQTFLRHVVTELGRGQQVWLQQAQRQVERMAAAQLERIRQDFGTMVKQFAELLLQQTQGQQASQMTSAPPPLSDQPSLEFAFQTESAAATGETQPFPEVPESQS
jgi:hypothetical protein